MKIDFLGVHKKYSFCKNGHIYTTCNGINFYGAGIKTVTDVELLKELREAYDYYV